MVCRHCTLLHTDYPVICRQCGQPLLSNLRRSTAWLSANAPVALGVLSGTALMICLSATLIVPSVAGLALNLGAYFGIISIANVWLTVYRRDDEEALRGLRGLGYSLALMISLVAELSRLQGLQSVSLPVLGGQPVAVPIPSSMATEMLAAALIVGDPLIVRPLLAWIAAGVEHEEHLA